MKGRGIAVLAATALLAAALVAGCGSSSSGSAATDQSSEPLTRTQFLKQAEQICQQGVKKKEKAVSAVLEESASQEGGANSHQIKGLMEDSIVPLYSEVIDELGALSPPKGNEAKLKGILQKYESALKSVEADPAKAAQGENPFAAADEAAVAYGIETCRL